MTFNVNNLNNIPLGSPYLDDLNNDNNVDNQNVNGDLNVHHSNQPANHLSLDPVNNNEEQQVNNNPVNQDEALNNAVNKNDNVNNQLKGNIIAVNNNMEVAHDWSFSDAKGLKEITSHAALKIKENIEGKQRLEQLKSDVTTRFQEKVDLLDKEINALDEKISQLAEGDPKKETLLNQKDKYLHMKESFVAKKNKILVNIDKLMEARAKISSGIPSKFEDANPVDSLNKIKRSLRVFRYEVQSIASDKNLKVEKMNVLESAFRAIQHFFKKGNVSHHVTASEVDNVIKCEKDLFKAIEEVNVGLDGRKKIDLGNGLSFDSNLNETLEVSHQTNNQIRNFLKAEKEAESIRNLFRNITEKGGSRKVEFSVSAGAMIGLGLEVSEASIKANVKFTVSANVNASGKNGPIDVTYTYSPSVQAGVSFKGGKKSEYAGLSADANVGASYSYSSTRTYETMDDFILDANNNKLARAKPIGEMILGAGKLLYGVVKLGVKKAGAHKGDVTKTNLQYLEQLRQRNMIGQADSFLLRRRNPNITKTRTVHTINFDASASVKASIKKDIFDVGLGLSAKHSRDVKVTSRAYSPFAKTLRNAVDLNTLNALKIKNPVDNTDLPIVSADQLSNNYKQLLLDVGSKTKLTGNDARVFANNIRNLMISAEIARRNGQISDEVCDKLFLQFSNFDVKIPMSIYREYLMDFHQGATPAKKRTFIEESFKFTVLPNMMKDVDTNTKNITGTIGDEVLQSEIKGLTQEYRNKLNLDTNIKLGVTFESPNAKDPRPWENRDKVTIDVNMNKSIIVNQLIECITKTIEKRVKKDNKVEQGGAKKLKDEFAKEILPNIVIGFANEGVKNHIMEWMGKSENVEKLAMYAINNKSETIESLVNKLDFCIKHNKDLSKLTPDELKEQTVAKLYGSSSKISSEHTNNKSVSFSIIDGKLETISVKTTKTDKFSVNIEPKGVSVAPTFSLSYSVSESVIDRNITVNSSLLTLLGQTEGKILSDNTLNPSYKTEGVKNLIANNFYATKKVFTNLTKSPEAQKLFNDAKLIAAENNDIDTKNLLDNAWIECSNLNENSNKDDIVNSGSKLLIAMTLAYRSNLPAIE